MLGSFDLNSSASSSGTLPNGTSPLPFTPSADDGKSPVAKLYEYCSRKYQQSPAFKQAVVRGGLFQSSVVVEGRRCFGEVCRNKRAAKLSSAKCALDTLHVLERNSGGTPQSDGLRDGLIAERFQHSLRAVFAAVASRDVTFVGTDKVLAGIFMIDFLAGRCHLISWATGNKCIGGGNLSFNGDVVHDCHAEVLCRRGLQRFVYSQLELFMRNPTESIFHSTTSKQLALRPSLSFHLFINTAPCGDGRVYSFCSAEDNTSGLAHRPSLDPKAGQLRTKIEFGEGTVYIPAQLHEQTMDGLRIGERLRTMSCSDKVLKWNALGLQGCLLSSFVKPLYLSSLTLEQLFHYGHLSRSVCCRLGNSFKVPPPFRLVHPYLSSCSKVSQRSAGKSFSTSINWNISDGDLEVLNATTGRVMGTNATSRLCKRAMFESFCCVARAAHGEGAAQVRKLSYSQAKARCGEYASARFAFEKALFDGGCGRWLKKPAETKDFFIDSYFR